MEMNADKHLTLASSISGRVYGKRVVERGISLAERERKLCLMYLNKTSNIGETTRSEKHQKQVAILAEVLKQVGLSQDENRNPHLKGWAEGSRDQKNST